MDAADQQPADPVPAGRPAHSSRPLPRLNRAAAAAGIAAALVAAVVGTVALIRDSGDARSGPRSLNAITVPSSPTAVVPLTEPEILALLDRSPEFGPLGDAARRTSCLAGLGYPASTRVLGARPLDIGGRPAILLLLPGDARGAVIALAVAPNCSSADTGLLADTTVTRP